MPKTVDSILSTKNRERREVSERGESGEERGRGEKEDNFHTCNINEP
jgi:hypothetical protein